MERGILSHTSTVGILHASIAMPEIQDRRTRVKVPGGRQLHDYVNLYFHARNPMMYKRRARHADMTVLRVSPTILDVPGVVITDGNASSDYIRFASGASGLAIVDRDRTYAM